MLFNELIILHVGDLDHDIKENIVHRSENDSMISIQSIYDYNNNLEINNIDYYNEMD